MKPLFSFQPKHVLCLGAHSDDIEIGCGGTLLRIRESAPNCKFTWVVLSGDQLRVSEAQNSAEAFLGDSDWEIRFGNFRDAFMPFDGESVKEFIHAISSEIDPDIVFTHRLEDRHQDHRLLSEVTWNAFRSHSIFEYEIPKYEGDLGNPNMYVSIPEPMVDYKIKSLCRHFPTQAEKPWFDDETFRSMMRIRGLECHSPSCYAEGFYCRKIMI